MVDLDPVNPQVPGTPIDRLGSSPPLKPHQVTFMAWASIMEPLLGGWALCDEMGLGKTKASLAFIAYVALRSGAPPFEELEASKNTSKLSIHKSEPPAMPLDGPAEASRTAGEAIPDDGLASPVDEGEVEADDGDDEVPEAPHYESHVHRQLAECQEIAARIAHRTYKATLICVPPTTVAVWKEELRGSFPILQVKYFVGSPSSGTYRDRQQTLRTELKHLLRHLVALPDTPEALLHVVLTSYPTWVSRSRIEDMNGPLLPQGR